VSRQYVRIAQHPPARRLQVAPRSTRLTEASVDVALREIRLALLEADVNFRVVKAFIDRVRAKAVGEEVLRSLTPDQQVVRIVRDEMLAMFGEAPGGLPPTTKSPRVILMLGLQGLGQDDDLGQAGATADEAGASIRCWCRPTSGVRRRIQQLSVLAEQVGVRVHDPANEMDPVARAAGALDSMKTLGFDTLIVDTAGRLHIDDELMAELVAIRASVDPSDLLYVADAMTGQDAVKSAGEFHHRMGVSGVVLTKMDGDARGGAALSVVGVVGVPIAFVGVGERGPGSGGVSRRPAGLADARHGRRALADRARRGSRRRRDPGEAREQSPARRFYARGFPRSVADDPEDGGRSNKCSG
jgi:signal recognition particle subunit SRP54